MLVFAVYRHTYLYHISGGIPVNNKFKIECTCKTCDFNMGGICVGGDKTHLYGHTISDINTGCSGWHESFDYFMEMENNTPWYIKKPYRLGNAYGKHRVPLLEMDFNNEPIDVDLYELIFHLYCIDRFELAEILNVSVGVINYAQTHGTPCKRKANFASVLHIPMQYFNRVTTLDFPIIEKCRDAFMQEWADRLPRIKEIVRKKHEDKFQQARLDAQPYFQKKKADFLARYQNADLTHNDMSEDYFKRHYTVAIRLQEDEFFGYIYDEIETTEYGLPAIMKSIHRFIEELTDEDNLAAYYEETFIIDDIDLGVSSDGKMLNFTLHDIDKNTLEKSIHPSMLSNYIVGINIIDAVGAGRKKEHRKCSLCKHFTPNSNNAKGYCAKKNDTVSRSRIICKFGFEPQDNC